MDELTQEESKERVKEGEDGNRKKLMENEHLCAYIGQTDWRENIGERLYNSPPAVVREPMMLTRNFESEITGGVHLKIPRWCACILKFENSDFVTICAIE